MKGCGTQLLPAPHGSRLPAGCRASGPWFACARDEQGEGCRAGPRIIDLVTWRGATLVTCGGVRPVPLLRTEPPAQAASRRCSAACGAGAAQPQGKRGSAAGAWLEGGGGKGAAGGALAARGPQAGGDVRPRE